MPGLERDHLPQHAFGLLVPPLHQERTSSSEAAKCGFASEGRRAPELPRRLLNLAVDEEQRPGAIPRFRVARLHQRRPSIRRDGIACSRSPFQGQAEPEMRVRRSGADVRAGLERCDSLRHTASLHARNTKIAQHGWATWIQHGRLLQHYNSRVGAPAFQKAFGPGEQGRLRLALRYFHLHRRTVKLSTCSRM